MPFDALSAAKSAILGSDGSAGGGCKLLPWGNDVFENDSPFGSTAVSQNLSIDKLQAGS